MTPDGFTRHHPRGLSASSQAGEWSPCLSSTGAVENTAFTQRPTSGTMNVGWPAVTRRGVAQRAPPSRSLKEPLGGSTGPATVEESATTQCSFRPRNGYTSPSKNAGASTVRAPKYRPFCSRISRSRGQSTLLLPKEQRLATDDRHST